MAPHSSALAWKSPWTEEPGRLQAVHGVAKSRTQLSNFTFTFHFHALEKEMATHSSVLDWRIPGMGEPGGLLSMESQRVRHNWSNLAAAAADKEPAGPRASSTLFWGKDSGQSTKSWYLKTGYLVLTHELVLPWQGCSHVVLFEGSYLACQLGQSLILCMPIRLAA